MMTNKSYHGIRIINDAVDLATNNPQYGNNVTDMALSFVSGFSDKESHVITEQDGEDLAFIAQLFLSQVKNPPPKPNLF